MSAGSALFQRIHELHQQIHDLQVKVATGPRLMAGLRAAIQAHLTDIEAMAAERKQLRMEADRNQVKLDGGEERLTKEQLRLNMAKDNKEYSATRREMSHIEQANSELEDTILDRLARADQIQKKIEAKRLLIAGEEAELQQLAAQAEIDRDRDQRYLDLRQAELAEVEERLDSATRDAYQRRVDAMGREALAPVRDMVCGGCFTGITAQSQNELTISREMVLCKSCGRILYIPGEPATPGS